MLLTLLSGQTPLAIPSADGISIYSTGNSNLYEDAAGTIPSVTDSLVGNVSDFRALLSAFTQSASSSKPIKRYTSSLYNLELDGVDDGLSLASVLLSEAGDYTICIGVRSEDVAGTVVLFGQRGASANPTSCLIEMVSGVPRARWKNDAGTEIILASGLATQAWTNMTVTVTKSGNTRTLRVNGTQVATDTTALGATTLTQTGIGFDAYALTGFMPGLLTNIVVHPSSALTGSDLVAVENWVTANNQIPASTPSLSIDDITVAESVGNATFTVTMTRTQSTNVTVDYATSSGSATSGSDFTSTSGTLTFTPGQTSKTIDVPITNDVTEEGAETFTMTLSNVSANATISDVTGTCTISANDDVASLIQSLGGILVDFTAATTGVTVGNAISTVTTSEGNAYTFTSTNSPTLQQNGNGKTYAQLTSSSSMKFTPSAGASETAFAALCADNTDSVTVMAAVQMDDVSGGTWKCLVAWAHAANQYVQVQANGTLVIANQRQTTTSQDATKGTLSVSTDCTIGAVKNGTASRKAMLNGALGTANTTDFTESVSYEYNTIGCNRKGAGAGSDYFNGRIYAIAIIPSDISATGDFTTIQNWLAARYAA